MGSMSQHVLEKSRLQHSAWLKTSFIFSSPVTSIWGYTIVYATRWLLLSNSSLLIGVRPGEIIESDAWRQSNEGLHYRDVELIYQRTETYHGWLLYVKLRNRKGHREYKKHAYAAP